MSDITRDDLRAVEVRNIDGERPEVIYHRLTDEEFDRLALQRALELGYMPIAGVIANSTRSKVLRALLTDECPDEECVNGYLGEYEHVDPYTGEHLGNELIKHEVCGGRGWLPKDSMATIVTEYLMDHGLGNYPSDVVIALADGVVRVLLADWLEADNDPERSLPPAR